MTKVSAIFMALALGACSVITPRIKTEYKVIMPEEKYFECEKVVLPDPTTLSDTQISSLIASLVKNNRLCFNNMQALHEYLSTAKKTLEAK